MVMLTKKSTGTNQKDMLGPGEHTRAWGREGELNCKYSLSTDISENLLLKPLSVYDNFLNLFENK